MSELNLLTRKRGFKRKYVTETHNSRNRFDSMSNSERGKVKSKLNDTLNELKNLNSEIQSLKFCSEIIIDNELEDEMTSCDDYESKVFECLSELESNTNTVITSGNQTVNGTSARSLLRSPVAPLPSFQSKEGEDFSKFLTEFEQTVSMYGFSEYDKFILLKQQISGRALVLVNSLGSDKGFSHAKTLLESAFNSLEIKTSNVIEQLISLKLSVDEDPFVYISKVKNIIETVDKLDLKTESFLQHFIWKGLNSLFQTQLIQITNKNKPSIKEIQDNFFTACDSYKTSCKAKEVDSKKKITHLLQYK